MAHCQVHDVGTAQPLHIATRQHIKVIGYLWTISAIADSTVAAMATAAETNSIRQLLLSLLGIAVLQGRAAILRTLAAKKL
jgi:hypothetical protein